MFKNGRLRKVLITTILLVLVLSTVALAANNIYEKKLTATHGRIKFKVDGKDVTKEIESKYGSPAFTVKEYDNRSYVPVRAIAELMGMKVEYDDSTHTAEIIDIKSEQYEKELEKKDKEIEELKKEIEKLKKNVVDETDLKAMEKKLNNDYSTYQSVDFDISLKESKSRIDIDISMDLRDSRQESYWERMGYNYKKEMIEDIVSIISKEFTDIDIYGSIYDEYYNKDVITFNKKSNSNLSISYDGRSSDIYDRYYLDDVVYDEFESVGIRNATISGLNASGSTISFKINFSSSSGNESEWDRLGDGTLEGILDVISEEAKYYYDDYYYDQRYDDYYDYVDISVYMGSDRVAVYERDLDKRTGELKSRTR